MERKFKGFLLVFVMLMVIINYNAVIEILGTCLLQPLNDYAHSLGYVLNLKDEILFVFQKLVPVGVVLTFLLEVSSKTFRVKMHTLYNSINNLQLIILSVLLPGLLYLQNHFLSHFLALNTPNTPKK